MTHARKRKIGWRSEAEGHDYPAAKSYLSLLYPADEVRGMIARLKGAPVVKFMAKDIFRASRLSLLGVSNAHVQRDREKIREGQDLSPILLVRDGKNGVLVIADGYHRLCAVYEIDEDALIPCKII
jgi:hypothetical protein